MSKRHEERLAARSNDLTPVETLAAEIFTRLAIQETGGWTMAHMAKRSIEAAETFFATLRQPRDETNSQTETEPKEG